MQNLVDLGLYIGINGCSLRDSFDVIPHIPEDRLLIETDSPYCDIKPTHPAYAFLDGFKLPQMVKPEKFTPGVLVKGRNEPSCVNQVAFAIAGIRQCDFQRLSLSIRSNTLRLFKKIAK
jgi:TatD DNase family protein